MGSETPIRNQFGTIIGLQPKDETEHVQSLSIGWCNWFPIINYVGNRPSKRIANWLRIRVQLCTGAVHFRVMSRFTKNNSLRAASPVGKAPLLFVTLRSCRL